MTSGDHVLRPARPADYDAIAAVVGLLVLVVGMVLVRNSSVSDFEEDVFRAVNDLPEALYPVAWPFQQVGALVAGPVVAMKRASRPETRSWTSGSAR